MRKILFPIWMVAFSSCSTVDKSHLSETNLEAFPDHSCLRESAPDVTFNADKEFEEIVAGLGADDFSTRTAYQRQLNDLLLTGNKDGRIRYLINAFLNNEYDAEVKARLKGALQVCKAAATKQVEPCPIMPDAPITLVRPRGGINEETRDRVVISLTDNYQVSKNDLFSVAGDSCREVAELTLERYMALEKIVSEVFKSPINPFKVHITPSQEALVTPEACCRQGRDVFLRLVDSYPGYAHYDRTAPTELQLVDQTELSAAGFESLCKKEGGIALTADPEKLEYLKYDSGDVIFLGHMNQVEPAVLTLASSGAPPYQEPDAHTQSVENVKMMSLGCFKQGSDAEVTHEALDYGI